MIQPSPVASDAPASSSRSPAPATREKKPIRWHLWALLFLTCVSGVLCFNRLSFPPLLIDECFTYWRVCGTLGELLDTLRNDAFVPLYYELLNWVHQGFTLGAGIHLIPGGILLTPTVMRFIPAICGTLMTPVMYFLARQLFNRRTALIAAAFITCSAYGLFFSRNAKMYTPAWMLMTLSIACFLWWMRTWLRLAWLCWIASGIAAGGVHAITLLMLPLPLLYFISKGRFRGLRVPMLLFGLGMIAVGPAMYYRYYNRWTQQSGGILPGVVGEPAPDARWDASGLNWLEPTDNSLQPPFAALNAYISGFEWSTLDDLVSPAPFVAKFSGTMIALFAVTYGLFILGSVPWPHLRQISASDPPVEPWWRSLLWLVLWLVLPVYGFFYCRSIDNFSSPLDWLDTLFQFAQPHWFGSIIGIAAVAFGLNFWPRIAKFIAIPLLLLFLAAVTQTARNHLNWFTCFDSPLFRLAVLAIIPGVLFHYAGTSLRQRTIETLRLLAVIGVVLVLCYGLFLLWRWLHDLSLRKNPDLPWQTMWHTRYIAIVWPAVWLAAAALISRLPTRALQIAAVVTICSFNLANGLAREYYPTEVPLDRVMADIYSSQPHSGIRTYFNMHPLFDSPYYRPLASYNACNAAQLQPNPVEFRVGKTWPFQWGTIVTQFKNRCIYTPTIEPETIRADLAQNPDVATVIVWEVIRPQFSTWDFDDPASAGLDNGWSRKSDEQIIAHWYWDWHEQWFFRRLEFQRNPKK